MTDAGDGGSRHKVGNGDDSAGKQSIDTEGLDKAVEAGGKQVTSTGSLAEGPMTRDAGGSVSIAGSRLIAAIEPVSSRARRFVGFFGTLGLLSGLSALVLVLLFYLPFEPFAWWKAAAAVTTLLVLAVPAAILFVFRLGLHQLVTLPERLVDASAELSSASREAYSAVSGGSGRRVGRLLSLIQSIARLRSLLFDSREALVGASVLVRVANPIVLVLVLASIVLSGVMITVAAIAGAVAIF